jgi:hypothetical protein
MVVGALRTRPLAGADIESERLHMVQRIPLRELSPQQVHDPLTGLVSRGVHDPERVLQRVAEPEPVSSARLDEARRT